MYQISQNDSISNQQFEIGFSKSWKLCLNLRSSKWLWTILGFVINSISLGLWLLKALLADGAINLRILFLKILRQFEFLKFRLRLFHSIMPDRKKCFFKKLFCFIKEHFAYFWKSIQSSLQGLIWRYCGDSFL